MTTDETNDPSAPTPVASYATEGEADVAVAKLRAFGIEAAVDDHVEGGTVPVEGEDGVVVEVRAEDAADAARILDEDSAPTDG
jgi:hypothetical protein